MRLRPIALAIAACAIATPAIGQLAALTPPLSALADAARLSATVDSIARHAMHDQAIGAMSVAIVKDGRVVLERGWGEERGGDHLPATVNSEYQIASVTKQFTASAILLLANEGLLRLDDSISRYVDGLPPAYRAVTIQRLLNHTAGVPNFTEFFREFRQPLAPSRLVDSLAVRPLLFAPGTAFHYSNSGYYLLGLAIERVTGQAYDEVLRERFWQPLGLADTRYCESTPGAPLPSGFGRDRHGDMVPVAPWDPSILFAAGSLCSTAADLATWTVALGEGRVLPDSLYRAMTSPTESPDRHLRMSYGYGMMVDSTEAGPYLHHDGAVSGFRAQVAWYPDEHLAVVVLMNQGMAAPEPIERDLTRAVLGDVPRGPRLAGPPLGTPTAAGSLQP